jgi:hypothetical protein
MHLLLRFRGWRFCRFFNLGGFTSPHFWYLIYWSLLGFTVSIRKILFLAFPKIPKFANIGVRMQNLSSSSYAQFSIDEQSGIIGPGTGLGFSNSGVPALHRAWRWNVRSSLEPTGMTMKQRFFAAGAQNKGF